MGKFSFSKRGLDVNEEFLQAIWCFLHISIELVLHPEKLAYNKWFKSVLKEFLV